MRILAIDCEGAPVSKPCTRCGLEKPASEFSPRKLPSGKPGLASWCKVCYAAHRKASGYQRSWQNANRDRLKKYQRAHYEKKMATEEGRSKLSLKQKDVLRKLLLGVIEAYGGKCACCGESQWEFLTIDHIYGRKNSSDNTSRNQAGGYTYRWLRRHGYPKDEFRLLCYNCNCSRGRFGYCPHEGAQ